MFRRTGEFCRHAVDFCFAAQGDQSPNSLGAFGYQGFVDVKRMRAGRSEKSLGVLGIVKFGCCGPAVMPIPRLEVVGITHGRAVESRHLKLTVQKYGFINKCFEKWLKIV